MSKPRVSVAAVLSGKSQREVARLYGISQPRVSRLLTTWRACEFIRELTIDPNKDGQLCGVKSGPSPGHRKGGMPKGYKSHEKQTCPGTSDKDVLGHHIGAASGI